ncbi:MAG: Helicase PriA essential for oriC/DnaA-independent DNA replication [uncultured Sulfurovum sp.]|uniref:Replication restart protein PriA n=1 Tax=uncultured Sulfurovum sp. TaxID=269237 RepID=A0A6S6SKA3_9BACT|nr:MAG: Helicase PriA essential for oriC/DnaA-independent DNA replication [uncultured Sulfurovum sp.]
MILEEVQKPEEFETLEISNVLDTYYSSPQIEIAKFIASYYFSSLGEALALFVPCRFDLIEHKNKIEADENVRLNRTYELPTLSNDQQKAYEELLTKDKALLFGVTGSGKTEVFISLMAKTISEKERCIFLMPEISLTPQMEKRLKKYFGERLVMWHSKLTKKKKEEILEKIYNNEVDIVAGARSALFTPLEDVGLIIVDEEHDDSYKSMMKPRYHARDMAVYMGAKLGAKVVMASATPSLASYHKYDVIRLKKPFIETKKNYYFVEGTTLTNQMIKKIKANFEEEQQSLLFVPTRGNFKYLYCQKCGETHLCPYCSVGMALHRNVRHLKCHYCNYTEAIREVCSACGHVPLTSERMGTSEAKEMVEQGIPELVVEQFDRDSITTAGKLKKALKRFENKESHLLLGTQMLSKGHDYANITLSVILGMDYILGLGDYRARERAMSLLIQVAGRSGRAKSAEVIVQSQNADFFSMYLNDYEAFLKDEMLFVEDMYPPFVSLARILISHVKEEKAGKITLDTVTKLKMFKDIEIVGQGKAPIERIANKFRFNILLRASKRSTMLKALHQVKNPLIEIDMDPVEFS